MNTITVCGPLLDEQAAIETMLQMGRVNHSVYSRSLKDADGYDTDERQWFVERDLTIIPERIFGMTWAEIQAKQGRRHQYGRIV